MSHVWAFVGCFLVLSSFSLSLFYFLSTVYLLSVLHINFHNVESAEDLTQCAPAQWGVLLHGDTQPSHRLWAQPPRQLRLVRDFCNIFQYESGDIDTEPSYSCDAELDDEIFGTAPSSPLFIQEREEPANLRQAYHSHEEILMPAQSFIAHTSTERPVYEPRSSQKRKSGRDMENERTRILFERQKEQVLAEVRTEIQPILIEQVSRNWMELSGLSEVKLIILLQVMNIPTRTTTSSWTVIEAKSGPSWSSWEKSQWDGGIEAISRLYIRYNCDEKIGWRSRHYPWTHCQDTGITKWNLLYEWFERFSRCRICTKWTSPRYQSTCVFPTPSSSWWNAKPFSGNAEQQHWAAKYLGHTWYIGKRFCKSNGVFFSTLSAGIESMEFSYVGTNSLINGGEETSSGSERPVRTSKNSVIFSGGDSSKNYGADRQRLQISDPHFDKFPNPATFACWKIRFKIEVCTCSQFPTEALLWIKEVEMVGSVDDLKSSPSVKGTPRPGFELLDARNASALIRIIHNSHFKRRVSLEEQKAQKEDRFLRGRQIAYLIYGYFRVTGANDSVDNYADLFTVVLRNDDIQEFDSKLGWSFIINDENPIWWHLGKLLQIKNTRVWETKDCIGVVQNGDSSEERWTWLSQIENYVRKKYRAEFGN